MCEVPQKRQKYHFVQYECYFTTARFWFNSNVCIYFWMKDFSSYLVFKMDLLWNIQVPLMFLVLFEQNNSFCGNNVHLIHFITLKIVMLMVYFIDIS